MIVRQGARRSVAGILLWVAVAGAAHAEEAPAAAQPIDEWFDFGASVEFAHERRRNFNLDGGNGDDVDLLPVELQLEVSFAPNEFFAAYIQPRLTHHFGLRTEGTDQVPDTELIVEEAYATIAYPNWDLSLQVGRQTFEDDRQWLYDAELDAVRAAYRTSDVAIELSVSRKALVDNDLLNEVDEEPVNTYILHGKYHPTRTMALGGYGLFSDHRGGERDRLIFLGLHGSGTIGDRLAYWLDAAHVRGFEAGQNLLGYGVDVLGTYRFDAPLSPYVTLGYAFGSGDRDADDGDDTAFRQTGLQGNEAEVGGLTPVRYYGEAFDPELSNLMVFTAGLGARPSAGASVDLVYHYYLQDQASDELRDSALDADPTGRSRRLGHEIDLVVGFEEVAGLRVRGFFGYFMPGRAFGADADDAYFWRIEATYEF